MVTSRQFLIGVLTVVVVLALPGGSRSQGCIATGDVDCSGGPPTIGDVSAMVDFFIDTGTVPPCPYQMDITGDCVVDRTDFWYLMSCLLDPDVPPCPQVPTCCDPVLDRFCCSGGLGDPNGSRGEPTIGDISVIIDAKFITSNCDNICISAADINRSGGSNPTCNDITIGDISMLIDCLFISGNILPCYQPCM